MAFTTLTFPLLYSEQFSTPSTDYFYLTHLLAPRPIYFVPGPSGCFLFLLFFRSKLNPNDFSTVWAPTLKSLLRFRWQYVHRSHNQESAITFNTLHLQLVTHYLLPYFVPGPPRFGSITGSMRLSVMATGIPGMSSHSTQ